LLWIVFLGTRQQIPQRSKVPWLLVVGLFNNAIPFTCFAWGERVVPSNIAAVLNATTPIFTLLIGMMIERRRAGWRVVAGVLLGFSGVLLVVLNNVSATSLHVAHATFYDGIILITTGALGYAVATVIAKAKLQGVTPIGIAASQLASASLIVLPLALLGPHPAAVRTSAWMAVIVLGLLGTAGWHICSSFIFCGRCRQRVRLPSLACCPSGVFCGELSRMSLLARSPTLEWR
jgi:drug/metabolite transporter (DMT)-like permease